MLLDETTSTGSNFFAQYGLLIILVVMLVAMFVFNFIRQKKYQQQEAQMVQEIKVGTKVKTYAGIYGTVVGMYDSTDGKVAILSIDGKSTMEIDFRSIYAVDAKTEVVETSQEQPVSEETSPETPTEPNESKDDKPTKKSKREKNQD